MEYRKTYNSFNEIVRAGSFLVRPIPRSGFDISSGSRWRRVGIAGVPVRPPPP